QIILQDNEHGGTQQRAPEGAHATHHRHHDEITGLAVVQTSGISKIVDEGVERASKSHEKTRQSKCNPDVTLDRNTQETGATFVLADRDHGTAEWRSQNESHRANSDRKTKQNEVIEVVGVRQDVDLEEPKMERLARESTQAVIAAGERAPLKCNIIKHLTESDGDHREIDAASAYDQRTQ